LNVELAAINFLHGLKVT